MTDGTKKMREALAIAYNIIIRYVSERDLNKEGLKIIKKALDESKALSSPPAVEGGNNEEIAKELAEHLSDWGYNKECECTESLLCDRCGFIGFAIAPIEEALEEKDNQLWSKHREEIASLQAKLDKAVMGLENYAEHKESNCWCEGCHWQHEVAQETLDKVKER